MAIVSFDSTAQFKIEIPDELYNKYINICSKYEQITDYDSEEFDKISEEYDRVEQEVRDYIYQNMEKAIYTGTLYTAECIDYVNE